MSETNEMLRLPHSHRRNFFEVVCAARGMSETWNGKQTAETQTRCHRFGSAFAKLTNFKRPF